MQDYGEQQTNISKVDPCFSLLFLIVFSPARGVNVCLHALSTLIFFFIIIVDLGIDSFYTRITSTDIFSLLCETSIKIQGEEI